MPEPQLRMREPGPAAAQLARSLDPLLARIFSARGVTEPGQLQLSLQQLLPPTLRGIQAAADLLADAISAQRPIKIVGDFDADGATASALAVLGLRAMGATQVSYLVPNRFDFGYGLTPEIVALAAKDGAQLLVTVDNGIASVAGVAAAKTAGMQVVITDHHLPGTELPAADAIVNPNQPGCEFPSKALAGVGVMFYVLSQLRATLSQRGWFAQQGLAPPNLAQFLDLVALGTVADVVPLDQNNRILVQQGLLRIRQGQTRPGISALIQIAGRDQARLSAQDLAFALAPRINAAGRLDDMSLGIQALLAEDMAAMRAASTALEQQNNARRIIEQQMTKEAAALAAAAADNAEVDDAMGLCVYDPRWHQGVVGIVAGRLRERFHRPVIAFADAGAGDELKGSARSINGVHVRDVLAAVANRFPGLIQKFGGHAMAAGLSIRRVHLPQFRKAFTQEVNRWVTAEQLQAILLTDGELTPPQFRLETARLLAAQGPWGQHFPEPLFQGHFNLVHQRVVGEKHLKLSLTPVATSSAGQDAAQGQLLDAIAFNQPPLPATVRQVLVAYRLQENHYGGASNLQLQLEHLQPQPL